MAHFYIPAVAPGDCNVSPSENATMSRTIVTDAACSGSHVTGLEDVDPCWPIVFNSPSHWDTFV